MNNSCHDLVSCYFSDLVIFLKINRILLAVQISVKPLLRFGWPCSTQSWHYKTEKENLMTNQNQYGGWRDGRSFYIMLHLRILIQCKREQVRGLSERGVVFTALNVPPQAAVCHTVSVVLHHPTTSKKSQRGRPTHSTPTHHEAAYSGNSHPSGLY